MQRLGNYSIWGFAFGYFACYVPYSALTKGLSSGFRGADPVPGIELLPVTALSSLIGMFVFITAMRWWRYATPWQLGPWRLPRPTRFTLLSGVCTAGVIATTTLAYTFAGTSIVFMMLLMRGGVLILAPLVDKLTGRSVQWFSIVGLALSIDALLISFLEDSGAGMGLTLIAAIDVAIYLGAYFVRLRFMSKLAKSDDASVRTRYFVEEQMVATPLLVAFLVVCALIGHGEFMQHLRAGFTTFFDRPIVIEAIVIGLFSQGTGIFGGLILLDKRENTYSVPVNRCSSILAGVVASYAVMLWMGGSGPSNHELLGAALIVQAILFLTLPLLAKRKA
jgi:NADH:ubiquinone oxidoreductase subunit 6 (subunit J)